MKSADIVLDRDYVYGTQGHWRTYKRIRVLELGKHQVVEGSDKAVPAARVLFVDDNLERWVVLRSIVMPWAEYEVAHAQMNVALQAKAANAPELAERARLAIKELAEVGFDTGTDQFELVSDLAVASGFVRVKVEFLEEVLEALSELEE